MITEEIKNNMTQTTIVAIATPPGNAGVGILRLSGNNSLSIVNKCFKSQTNLESNPRVAVYGTLSMPSFTDTVIAIFFPNPNSFTGEDVIEIHAHGGSFILQKILDHLISLGATMATAGEFSKRAFLNGKLSLDQAESIIELIHAESESHLNATNKVYQGKLKQKLLDVEKKLVESMAEITAVLDYPEHDIENTAINHIESNLNFVLNEIESLIDTTHEGRIISNGIQVAVLGKPNVGKSSLFNAILNRDRSIVTDIAGTTTDTISESMLYKGMKLVFNDTAGVRGNFVKYEIIISSHGAIEQMGIERTKRVVDDSDIVLAIFDGSTPPTDGDKEILELTRGKNSIFVLNKSDMVEDAAANKLDWFALLQTFNKGNVKIIMASAKTGGNVNSIKEMVYSSVTEQIKRTTTSSDEIIITNNRHLNELTSAYTLLKNVLSNKATTTIDCIAIDIEDALTHIGNITGTRANEAVIDEIFSRFCIGK